MDLQVLADRNLRKLAFSHVVHTVRRMNQKHKNEVENRKLQSILFLMLQAEDELRAKRALTVLCDLHRRRVWFDDRTANAICTACFHTSPRIMIAALLFLLGYEGGEDEDDNEDFSSDDDSSQKTQVVLNREAVYKANHKGTIASKKKKKAKLQRAFRSMKRQQRISSENKSSSYYSPLTHLKDAQGFVEKLFSRLQKCNERFEVKMMMLKVIARTVGFHRLILLNFYPFLQRYVLPHQREITELLASAVQACHEMVPPDAVEPLFRQIVNQFVHDRSRTESIAVGLNVVREICLRIPLLMNEDLLQDLVLYKKSHEKAVSTAARSLISLFREICPSLLVKKDRGRPSDPKARPKAFGEVSIISDVPGVELLEHDDGDEEDDDSTHLSSDNEGDGSDSVNDDEEEEDLESDDEEVDAEDFEDCESIDEDNVLLDASDSGDEKSDDENQDEDVDNDGSEKVKALCSESDIDGHDDENDIVKSITGKRKFVDYDVQLNAADTSLRALKRLAGAKIAQVSTEETDGILSNEDFQRIRVLKAKEEAKLTLARHGLMKKGTDPKASTFKVPSSEQLSVKRFDPAELEVNIKRKLSKDERLAMVKAGREDRGKFMSRVAIKKKKTGGLSNRQKEHKKAMPLAAKRAKSARSRQEKKKALKRSGKQFRGKKAWK